MKKISFIIPCYKSENTVTGVIDEIRSTVAEKPDWEYEIVCVDDCSPDNVYSVLGKLAADDVAIKTIRFSKNFGQHSAMIAGARNSTGDVCVFVDDDGQCPVDRVWDLVSPICSGEASSSIASYDSKKQSVIKNIGSFLHEFTIEHLVDKPHGIELSNFIACDRQVVNEIISYKGPYTHITGLIFRCSSHITNVPMEERKRSFGRSTYSFHKLLSLYISSFTAFSIKPLQFATVIGGIISAIGLVYAVYIIVSRLINPNISAGYSSLIAAILVIGGVILFVLGIIGEYIGRIYMSINGTPQYVIRESKNIKTKGADKLLDQLR